MIEPIISEEFIGRFIRSYKDGEILYAYDEITHGLYSFSFDSKKVNLVLQPENIHRNSADKIVGVAKGDDEIILVPNHLDSEWIFFDVKKETVRYDRPFEHRVYISGAIMIGTNLFLIPANTCNPIVVFSLDKMEAVKVFERWNKQMEEKNESPFWIWGASSCDDCVIFPIVESNCIGCVNAEDIRVITVDIPKTILSVSVYGDRIWVLPTSGEHIYESDFRGNIVNKVSLPQDGLKIRAKDFLRIAAAGETVFLFPVYGGNICAYQCRENQVVELKQQKKYLKGRLYEENLTPYWTYVVEDKILHLLPCDYHYKRINISSLDSEEYSLSYGKNINYTRYWEMMGNIQKECVLEKGESDLEDFLQYTLCNNKENFTEGNMKKGKEIWKRIG